MWRRRVSFVEDTVVQCGCIWRRWIPQRYTCQEDTRCTEVARTSQLLAVASTLLLQGTAVLDSNCRARALTNYSNATKWRTGTNLEYPLSNLETLIVTWPINYNVGVTIAFSDSQILPQSMQSMQYGQQPIASVPDINCRLSRLQYRLQGKQASMSHFLAMQNVQHRLVRSYHFRQEKGW